jgi:protein subunit release factor A
MISKIGMRSVKRRTYNFVRDEVVDHRTGTKVKGIRRVMDGDIERFIRAAQACAAAVASGEQAEDRWE